MAERWAVATGNWSSSSTWNGGTFPTSSDDIYANGFTVVIDQDVTALSLRTTAGTTAVAGGGFTLSSARSINLTGSGFIAGTTTCLTTNGTHSGSVLTGAVVGGSAANARGMLLGHNGTITINGNVYGGSSANSYGVWNAGASTLIVNGNSYGGSGTTSHGIYNASLGAVTVTGAVVGATNSGGCGLLNLSTAVVLI